MKKELEEVDIDMHFIQSMDMGFLPTREELADVLLWYKKLKHSIRGMSDQHISDYNSMLCEKLQHPPANGTPKPLRSPQKGIIYIVKSQELYKIGKTKNIESRFNTYRTENPHGVHLIFYKEVPDYYRTEKDLLFIFKSKQVRGEWFDLSPEDICWIRERIN